VEFVRLNADGAVGQGVMNAITGSAGPVIGLLAAGVIGQALGEHAVYRCFGGFVGACLVGLYCAQRAGPGAGGKRRRSDVVEVEMAETTF
jgi:hypothetical protein